MSLPRDGVYLVAENADRFIAAMEGATKATTGLSGKLDAAPMAAQNAGASLDILGGILQGVGQKLVDFAVQAVGKVIDGLIGIGKGIADLANEAAALQGVAAGFGNFAAQTEMGAQAMLFALQSASAGMISTQDLMTKFNDAAALVSVQFAERLPEGLEILSKVSAATGTDLNYLLDSFVKGIGRVQPLILDNLKIQVSVAEATAAASEMFGKEADALTKLEQQTALTDLTLAKLNEKFGGLPDVTQSATANLARIDAMFANIRAQLGAAFLPAWTTMTNAVANAVGWFSNAIQEGGLLFPILANLGAAASIAADAFETVTLKAIDFVDDISSAVTKLPGITSQSLIEMQGQSGTILNNIGSDLSSKMDSWISNALDWGANIAVSFAQGLIDGAASALTVAMNFISGMLSGWLAPGSPPKVAPDLPEWGAAAMTTYLEGFDQADFGVLKGIQGPLSKVLEKGAFADVSQEIARAIAGGGPGESLFAMIAESAGEFGTEIADLARLEFGLVASTDALAAAQMDLANSGKAVEDSQAKVAALTAEYNQMLRAGATEAQLAAQLKLINAAEQQRDAAIGQNAANRDALALAEKNVTIDQERVDNQRDLVDQIISLSEAEQAAADAASAASGGGRTGGVKVPGGAKAGGVSVPTIDALIPAGGINPFDMTGGLTAAIENAKALLLEKFGGIFDPIRQIIADKFGPDSPIGKKWAEISDQIAAVWETKLVPFWENTLKPAIDTVMVAFGNMQTWWETSAIPELAGEAFGIFIDTVMDLADRIIPFFTDQLLKISEWFIENGPLIDTVIGALVDAWALVAPVFVLAWDVIEPILDAIMDTILILGTSTLQFVTGDWTGAWETAQTVLDTWKNAAILTFFSYITGLVDMMKGEPWASFMSIWTGMWDNVLLTVNKVGADMLANIIISVDAITTWVANSWEIFKGWGRDMVRGLTQGITDKIQDAVDAVTEVAKKAIDAAKSALGIESPSTVFAGFGENTVAGFVEGIMGSQSMLDNAMGAMFGDNALQPIIQPTGRGMAMATADAAPLMREVSIQIGPNYFQNGDAQQLRRMVQQVMREELRRV